MDFEAQDDGVVAKLLVQPGSGEISIGAPIMVTVEEASDVAAFKDFVAGSAPSPVAVEASAPRIRRRQPQ
jgi:pyruvate dehydrogenase E2 component (dihydrolipoamide acetyltransferase)